MNVAFRCPRCQQTVRVDLAPDAEVLACPKCQAETEIAAGALADGQIHRCLVCPSRDLFFRKDFPQRLGVLLVIVGFVGFLASNYFYWTYLAFGFLFATAAIDVVLYLVVGEVLVCYRCGAHYRGLAKGGGHHGFELETHERYRQLAARLGSSTLRRPSTDRPNASGQRSAAGED